MSLSHELCIAEDIFLEDKTIWVVTLSDGLIVYQDDDRPNIDEPSAWKRLGSYVMNQNVYIVDMLFKFRSNRVPFTSNQVGYYFSKAITQDMSNSGNSNYYISGIYHSDVIDTTWYKVPELIETKFLRLKCPDIRKYFPRLIVDPRKVE